MIKSYVKRSELLVPILDFDEEVLSSDEVLMFRLHAIAEHVGNASNLMVSIAVFREGRESTLRSLPPFASHLEKSVLLW